MNINVINTLLAASLTGLVGIYPYIQRRDSITRLFALSNIFLTAWNLTDLFLQLNTSHAVKLCLFRLGYLGGVLLVPCFARFATAYAGIETQRIRSGLRILYVLSFFFTILALTPLILVDIHETAYPFDVPGRLYPLFLVYFLGGLSWPVYRTFTCFKSASGEKRNQLKYLFVAFTFGVAAAIIYFYSVYQTHMNNYYYYLQAVYAGILAYAMMAHHLMDINIIIRRTVVYSAVTAALTAIYVGIVTLLARVFEGATVTSSALAACAITLLFHPLRMKIQMFLDRHFFRDVLEAEYTGELASGLVHEVKRPLANISLPAELAFMDLKDVEEGKRSLKEVMPILQQRLKLIMDQAVQAGYKIEAVRAITTSQSAVPENLYVEDLLSGALAMEKGLFKESATKVNLQLSEESLEVLGQAKQLELALSNLIRNAVEAMNGRGTLTLSTERKGSQVAITIRDTGPGMSPEVLKRIFEPYFTTKGTRGMGIGLYLTQKIVKAHGGTLQAQSRPGEGTTFEIRLPISAHKTQAA